MFQADNKYFSTIRLIVLIIICTMPIMGDFTVSPVLPQLSKAFSDVANYELLVKFVLTLPAVFIAVSAPVAGILADCYGRRPVLLICIILYVIAGSSALILDSLYLILIGRAFMGISIGGLLTVSLTLFGDYYEGPQLSKYLGIQSGVVGFAGVLFLIIGGLLADYHWKFPFIVYLIPVIYFFFVYFFIVEPERKEAKAGDEKNQTPVKIPYLFILSVYLLAFLTMSVFYVIPVQLPFYLKELGNHSNAMTGIIIATGTLVSAFSSLLYKTFRDVFSYGSIFLISFGLLSIGYIYLSFVPNYHYVLVSMALIGFSVGLIIPNLSVLLIDNVPEQIRGRAVGGSTCTYFFGQFMSPIVVFPLIPFVSLKYLFMVVGIAVLIVVCIFMIFKFNVKKPVS